MCILISMTYNTKVLNRKKSTSELQMGEAEAFSFTTGVNVYFMNSFSFH